MHNAVLVARHDKTRVDQILAAAELLAETGTTLIGYTINGIEAGITGYGYGYGYGYGLDEEETTTKKGFWGKLCEWTRNKFQKK